ncbi:MAG: SdrD B-like domain-containing protein [Gammaproteobacteria bacterium]
MLISQAFKGLLTLFISVVIGTLSIQGSANANPEIVSVIADASLRELPVDPQEITEFNGQAYFSAGDTLWTSDASDVWKIKTFSSSGAPAALTVFDNHLFFFVDDGIHGTGLRKLWKSDGTEAGTVLVRDVVPDNSKIISDLTIVGNQLHFFISNDAEGYQLWKSDGSEAGTALVKNMMFNPFVREPEVLAALGDLLLFFADDGVHGRELWVSDGTESGTLMLKDVTRGADPSNLRDFARVGDVVYFLIDLDLWVSDGTEAGTVFVEKLSNIYSSLFAWGGRLYYAFDDEIRMIDGASSTIFMSGFCNSNYTHPIYGDIVIQDPIVSANKLYFTCGDNYRNDPSPMYEINQAGQVIGSIDIDFATPETIIKIGDTMYFGVFGGFRGNGYLWVSQGALADAQEFRNSGYAGLSVMGNADGKLYFSASDGMNGTQLWLQGNNGVMPITGLDGRNTINSFEHAVNVGGHVYISDDDQVWEVSQGIASSLFRFSEDFADTTFDLAYADHPDGWPGFMPAEDGSLLVLEARTDYYGRYGDFYNGFTLWKTDGTSSGSRIIGKFFGDHAAFTLLGNHLIYFGGQREYSFTADKLWGFDVATGVKTLLKGSEQIHDNSISNRTTVFNGELYFSYNSSDTGRELWKTDGTVNSTVLVADIHVGNKGSYPSSFGVFNNELYFFAGDGRHGRELWKTDGTASGTVRVSNISGGYKPFELTVADSGLYFKMYSSNTVTSDSPVQLWKSDGTAAGTERVYEVENNATDLFVFGDKVYFAVDDGVHGLELWVSDGSANGTRLLKDINPGSSDSLRRYSFQLTAYKNSLFFIADDGVHGHELWETDGTPAGTHLVDDFNAGAADSGIKKITVAGDSIYFSADDDVYQKVLWKYTPETTTPPPATGTGIMGDYVWRDDNGDGIQSPGEAGLANVAVELQTCTGDFVATTNTDSTGYFSFTKVAPAFFQMQFKLPTGHSFSPEKSTDLFKLDSNANVNTGITPCFDMTQGWKRLAIDAGMVPDAPTGGTPSMTLAISANGDSTVKPGPVLAEGSAVNWEYSVSNTGGTVLSNVTIRGREKVPVFGSWTALCSIGTIQPGATGSCSTSDAAAVSGNYLSLIIASADASDGTRLESIVKAFYKGEAGTPPPVGNDVVTLKNAIYFTGTKKLWIRATSDASPAGAATITARITVDGVERAGALGKIGWKAGKGFYQQVFFDIVSAPSSITLSSDQGGTVSGSIQVRN